MELKELFRSIVLKIGKSENKTTTPLGSGIATFELNELSVTVAKSSGKTSPLSLRFLMGGESYLLLDDGTILIEDSIPADDLEDFDPIYDAAVMLSGNDLEFARSFLEWRDSALAAYGY